MSLPILYSYRRCPYAMRARMALHYSQVQVEIREITFGNKPQQMLQVSPKGTVPVLMLADGQVIDESLDVMRWALAQHDSEDWLLAQSDELQQQAFVLIDENDGTFKKALDHYKYADRFPEHPPEFYRAQGEQFLQKLEVSLNQSNYLLGQYLSIADVAIFPFVRQFSAVDSHWFECAPYPSVKLWLSNLVESELFLSVMHKHPVWVS